MAEKKFLILNVGSTSTKAALFTGKEQRAVETIRYNDKELAPFTTLAEQLPLRAKGLREFVEKNGVDLGEIDMIVSRGGLGKPAEAGAYAIDEEMCRDLLDGRYGKHPSALGPAMAMEISRQYGMPAIIVDPPSTDEFQPLARLSGIPEIERKSAFHALNQKAAARRCAADIGRKYGESNFVVAHLGGGITVGAHRKGRVIDCTHGLSEGPFTPERAGSLPTADLIALAEKIDKKELQGRLVGRGGLSAYLGTTDARQVEEMVRSGDEKAKLVYEAMAYQIGKDIGAMAAVLQGRVDGIILTGGLAHSTLLTGAVKKYVESLSAVFIYPGEDEMTALAEGGLRAITKQEETKKY